MHVVSPSIPPASSEQPTQPSDWEVWEERVFALTDEIERTEGVPIEYAYYLAQLRLGMVYVPTSLEAVPLPAYADDSSILPF